ncbi:MAG: PAS domain S-box protein [Rhodospirillaceae bacterium]|nr:PAS domain S-box protein [Rhodospirillaceae bacterium]
MAAALDEAGLAALGRAVLHDIPDAVVYADRAGTIRYWNGGAARIFGYTAEEALGRSLDLIIPDRLRQRHWDGYRHVMETGRSRYGAGDLLAVPATTKSGATISIQFTVAAVRDADGAVAGIVAVMRDVTASFAELRRLRAEAAARG